MLHYMYLEIVCKLFQYNAESASQKSMPTGHRSQFLFLAVIYRLHVPSIIRSLPGNYTDTHRDPNKIIEACSAALTPELLAQFKHVLHHNNPSKFTGHVTAEKRQEPRICGNHASVAKHLPNAETTLNKEDQKMRNRLPLLVRTIFP